MGLVVRKHENTSKRASGDTPKDKGGYQMGALGSSSTPTCSQSEDKTHIRYLNRDFNKEDCEVSKRIERELKGVQRWLWDQREKARMSYIKI